VRSAIAALVAGAVIIPSSAAALQPLPFDGRIAFASIGSVIEMNPDGSGVWPARWGPTDLVDSWAPDGTRLLVDSAADVYAVDPDGGNRTRLTFDAAWDGHAAYSPDGTRIAFESSRDGRLRIWLMDADGSDPHLITANVEGANDPAWSPDGRELAFGDGAGNLWVTSADGIGQRLVYRADGSRALQPAWSPDGSTILATIDVDGNSDVYALDPAGGVLRRLTDSPAFDSSPAWAPDGTRIVFVSNRSGDRELWAMAPDGSGQMQLTWTGGAVSRPAWQPLGPPPAGFCTVWGTAANDLLVGTPGNDGICGEAGNDRIFGGDGQDALNGDDGNDTIVTGPGFDVVNAGPGDDTVDARDGGNDLVNGGGGTDTVLEDRRIDATLETEHRVFPDLDNLARGRAVRASLQLPTGPAAYAVDGHRSAFWSSLYARQWIEIDLGSPQTVGRVALAVAQTPEGETDHVILGRATEHSRWRGLAELRGRTHDRELLTAVAAKPWRNVRYLRIETRESPSWVAWKEIAVYPR
jgi:Ca2+-binding RTX toxin-like protein